MQRFTQNKNRIMRKNHLSVIIAAVLSLVLSTAKAAEVQKVLIFTKGKK